ILIEHRRSEISMIERPIPSEEIFHGPLGDIVNILDPHTEADPVGVLMSLMTMYSVAIGPEPSVKVGNSNQKLAVWTILAGDSGVGRKGTATGDARMVVEKAIPHLFDRTSHLVSAPNSGAGFVADLHSRALQNDWVVKKEDEDGEEYVTGLLPGFPALMIVPEMAAVFRTNRVDTTLSQNLREAWEGGSLSNVTKKESIVVDSPHVGIIGHITPTELETSLSESDSGGGTANRMLWVFVERSKRLKLGGNLTSEELERAASMFKEAVDFAADFGGTVTLSQEAKKYWLDVVYDEIDDIILSSESDSGGGTANRMLWVFVGRSKRLKLGRNLTSEELERAASMFKEAVDFAADFGGTVTLSQEAKKYWLDVVYDEIDDLILSSE